MVPSKGEHHEQEHNPRSPRSRDVRSYADPALGDCVTKPKNMSTEDYNRNNRERRRKKVSEDPTWKQEQSKKNREYANKRYKHAKENDPELLEKLRKGPRERARRLARELTTAERLCKRIRARCVQTGILFDMAPDDIVVPDVCPVLGIPLVSFSHNKGEQPSVDRMIPALGYVRGNVNVISHRANALKSDATSDELRAVADWMDNHKG